MALAGNPNSGKTTVFNSITGSRHHVANYPGVTVERRHGGRIHGDVEMTVLDLPGTYSLTPRSLDEVVARDSLLDDAPDVVIDVVDATNVERNLYLAVQLLELGVPLVLAFNMWDIAVSRGVAPDIQKLSERLGVPIVTTIGNKGTGIHELLDAVVEVSDGHRHSHTIKVDYGADVEEEIEALQELIARGNGQLPHHHRRWLALKLIEGDDKVRARIDDERILASAERSRSRLNGSPERALHQRLAESRYEMISRLCQQASPLAAPEETFSDRVDSVLLHRLYGVPIFLGLMYLVFHLTFTVGNPMSGWIEAGVGWIADAATGLWPSGSAVLLESLLVDGVVGGVGAVLVFLPNIVFLFLAIAILEDTGYMARAAFIMDRLMHKVGLHGKSFIPMLIGFGCNVPAIMATRTLEGRRDRMTTMLVIPLMSCSARLTIFALIIPAFFPLELQAPVLWTMYITGIVLAIVLANVLRSSTFKGESVGFLMELPPYRLPTARGAMIHMWERAWLYLRKAGTVILGISIVLWALTTFPRKADVGTTQSIADRAAPATVAGAGEPGHQAERLSYSIAGRLGRAMEPIIAPMGFDWKIGTALIGALAAKEVFVAQMGIVFSVGEADESSEALRAKLRRDYSPLVGFCVMLFTLIAAPCMATVAVTRRESNSWRWAIFQFGSLTLLAYMLTVAVYQVGSLLGIGI